MLVLVWLPWLELRDRSSPNQQRDITCDTHDNYYHVIECKEVEDPLRLTQFLKVPNSQGCVVHVHPGTHRLDFLSNSWNDDI